MPLKSFVAPTWIDSACLYASECGWHLVPFHQLDTQGRCTCGQAECSRPGDHPRFAEWREETANDEHTIESWAPLFPSSHLGVVCGPTSDLVVLEVSELHGRGATSAALSAQGRSIPRRTPHAVDRGARSLYFFRHPGGRVPLRTELEPGLHLFGDGMPLRIPHNHLSGTHASLRWHASPLADAPPPLPDWIAEAAGLHRGPAPVLPEVDAGHLPFDTAADLLALGPVARTDWLLQPWLWRGGLTLVTGAPLLAGKTTWCLRMAAALLAGSRFLGHPAAARRIAYLAEDDPAWFRRTLAGIGLDRSRLDAMSVLHASALHGLPWGELMRGVIDHCQRQGADVLFVDSLTSFAKMDGLDDVAGQGLHHALRAAMDAGLTVVATLGTTGEAVDEIVPQLGPLASSAHVVLNLRRATAHRPRTRIVEVASRLEAPTHVHVELDAEGLRAAGWPAAPLFAPEAQEPLGLFVENTAAA